MTIPGVEKQLKKTKGAVAFPEYTANYLGREVIDGVELMAADLAEYDELLMNQTASRHEVMEYLAVSGLLDSYPGFVVDLGSQLWAASSRAQTRLKSRNYSLSAIDKRMTSTVADWQQAIAATQRPLLTAASENVLRLCQSHGLFRWILKGKAGPLNHYFERSAAQHNSLKNKLLTDHLSFFALLSVLKKQPIPVPAEVSTEATTAADATFQNLIQQEFVPGTGQAVFDITDPRLGFFKKIILDLTPPTNPLILLTGAIDFNLFVQGSREPLLLHISVSMIRGELTLGEDSLRVLTQIGGDPTFKEVYPLLRKTVLDCIAQAIANGQIQIVTDTMTAQLDTLEAVPTATPVSAQMPAVPLAEANRAKPAEPVIRNLSYGRVIAALERCGVVVTSGGKHKKLTKETPTGTISVPFVNPHTGHSATLARVLKTALKVLGISREEFLEKL